MFGHFIILIPSAFLFLTISSFNFINSDFVSFSLSRADWDIDRAHILIFFVRSPFERIFPTTTIVSPVFTSASISFRFSERVFLVEEDSSLTRKFQEGFFTAKSIVFINSGLVFLLFL